MTDRTLAQLAHAEQQANIAAAKRTGLPISLARATVNNTDAEQVDSQGIAGSLARRAVPDASFNASTAEAYEGYDSSDNLYHHEVAKKSATVTVESAKSADAPPIRVALTSLFGREE